jgi:hypothetical protein
LYSEFLSLDGMYTININESMKQKVSKQINEHPDQVDDTLYNGVQLELELLMGADTLARYKLSESFKVAFQRSHICLKRPLLDEL